jgi:beta-lactam-binding protein with PASTA domain
MRNDGKIVAAGWSVLGRYRIALARYLPTYCDVPRLARRPLKTATQLLKAAHCTLGKVRRAYSKSVAKDRVVAQTPAAGSRRAENFRVALTVSRGKKKH